MYLIRKTYRESYTEWLLREKLKFEIRIKGPCVKIPSLDDFQIVNKIAIGSCGRRVDLVRSKVTGEYKALKSIENKRQLESVSKEVKRETRILSAIQFPFIVKFEGCLTNPCSNTHYLLMEFVRGGDLFSLLHIHKFLAVENARFYVAQLVLAIEYLHTMEVFYGDVKTENILLDHEGYIKLTDFGHAKRYCGPMKKLRGTYGYVAPEILRGEDYERSADWFAVGALLYELCAGQLPFYAESDEEIKAKTKAGKFTFPSSFPKDLRSIILKLLEPDPRRRYGNLRNGVWDIKEHEFFKLVNFEDLMRKKIQAPYIPKLKSPTDCRFFM